MRKTLPCGIPVVLLSILAMFTSSPAILSSATAAPIPRTGPLTIEGTVEDIRWTPEAVHEAMPGMSGTLAQRRTFPARYQVVLKNISILETGDYGLSVDRESGKAMLLLNHPSDDQFIKKGMRILVTGYEEGGDEGGNWSKHISVKVINDK